MKINTQKRQERRVADSLAGTEVIEQEEITSNSRRVELGWT